MFRGGAGHMPACLPAAMPWRGENYEMGAALLTRAERARMKTRGSRACRIKLVFRLCLPLTRTWLVLLLFALLASCMRLACTHDGNLDSLSVCTYRKCCRGRE